ncbi:CHAT domain-containing protein [Actinoplanes sp. NPDC051411]|uniref:CHAT domain-containing protein n=1 Tax=Actinoplanes sp. NPDC051411 TaxID=3155522 RepID=UPI0034296EA9
MDIADEELRTRYATAPAGGPAAARQASALGRRLATRYFRDGAGDEARDEAIDLLDEALTVPHDDATVTHVARGMLLFFRAMPITPGADPDGSKAAAITTALLSGTPADSAPVRAHLEWVSAHEPPGAEVRTLAEAMIVALDLLSGDTDPLRLLGSLARLGPAMAALGPGRQALIELLTAELADAGPERLLPAFDAVLRQLPAGHRLRPVLLAEAGAVVARRGHVAELPDTLAGLPAALAETLDRVRDDDPLRDQTVRKLAGLLVTATAYTGNAESVTRVAELADRLVAESGSGRDRFLRALTLVLRGRLADDPDDLRAAAEDLRAALATLPDDDELRPTAMAMLGVLLHDRHLGQGVLLDTEASGAFLAAASSASLASAASLTSATSVTSAASAASADERVVIRMAGVMSRTVLAIRRPDRAELDAVVLELEDALGALDDRYPWRSRLDAMLGLAYLAQGDLRRGAERLRRADADLLVEQSGRPVLRAAAEIADLVDGRPGDPRRLDEIAADAPPGDRLALRLLAATAAQARSAPDTVERYERLRDEPLRPGHPLAVHLHSRLALAYRAGGRTAEAVHSGLGALRALGDDVLLQSGTRHALKASRRAGELLGPVVEWAIEAGLHREALAAIELGRGITLHAAMIGATVPGLLRDIGEADLAAEWEAGPGEPPVYDPAQIVAGLVAPPSDLRPRVLAALAGRRLSAAPEPSEVAAVVRDAAADALVYLLPGRLLVVTAEGEVVVREVERLRLDAPDLGAFLGDPLGGPGSPGFLGGPGSPRFLGGPGSPRFLGGPGSRGDALGGREIGPGPRRPGDRVDAVCEWAWSALIEPVREVLGGPGRVVLVPIGGLGRVPWHAARSGERYAITEFTFSYAVSARHLRMVLDRPRAGDGPVFLVTGPGLTFAPAEVGILHETYSAAADASTPAEVLAALAASPAVLHLACHATTGDTPDRSHLRLAGPAELPVARILADARHRAADTPGGLVVLAACDSDLTTSDYDESLTIATAFLAAGAVSVTGSRWPVNDELTGCLMVVFHHFRTAGGLADRDALRAAQAWMIAPDRPVLAAVRSIYPLRPERLAEPAAWAAFTHHGR